MRWRVRLGYPVAVAVFWLARPAPRALFLGAAVGAVGLAVRAAAAGYLYKHERLAVAGPYAYTRNPLYLGSALLGAGFLVGAHCWAAAALVAGYFAFFYPAVMRREERELRARYGPVYEEYARRVPLFLPRLSAARTPGVEGELFSWAQYARNREYQAPIGFALAMTLLAVLRHWRG